MHQIIQKVLQELSHSFFAKTKAITKPNIKKNDPRNI